MKNFTEKDFKTLIQFMEDCRLSSDGEINHKAIKTLILTTPYVIENGDKIDLNLPENGKDKYFVEGEISSNGGHINIGKANTFTFNKDSYRYVYHGVEISELITPPTDTEPYNRQAPYYNGLSYDSLNKVDSFAGLEYYSSNILQSGHTCWLDCNNKYNEFSKSFKIFVYFDELKDAVAFNMIIRQLCNLISPSPKDYVKIEEYIAYHIDIEFISKVFNQKKSIKRSVSISATSNEDVKRIITEQYYPSNSYDILRCEIREEQVDDLV